MVNPQARSDGTGATASAAPSTASPSGSPAADGTDSSESTIARSVASGTVTSRPCQSW